MEKIDYNDCWVFLLGMNFQDKQKWWEKELRQNPHEGVDFYQTQNKKVDEKTQVPALSHGKVVKITDDFLGKTVFVQNNTQLYIYSHIKPTIQQNQTIKKQQIIGTLSKSKSPPSHLHLSIAQIPKNYPLENLTWQNINQDKKIKLIDPLNNLP